MQLIQSMTALGRGVFFWVHTKGLTSAGPYDGQFLLPSVPADDTRVHVRLPPFPWLLVDWSVISFPIRITFPSCLPLPSRNFPVGWLVWVALRFRVLANKRW